MKINKIIHWWFCRELPRKYIGKALKFKPEGIKNYIRDRYRTWVVHPIKRRIARYYLKLLQRYGNIKVVGITGSSGKTTTKEMIVSILKQKGEVVASFANIDPVFNIPTTIFLCKPSTKYLILEMGVEYPGEMDFYLWLAEPNMCVITNIFPTHTLFFKNERGVAKEKGKLARRLSRKGICVLNSENVFTREIGEKLKAEAVWFGKNSKVSAENIRFEISKGTKFMLNINQYTKVVQIPVLGKQFVSDALAASAACMKLGASISQIEKGLQEFKPQEHRMKVFRLKPDVILIDDSYNNNPEAAKEALKTFWESTGGMKKIVVFGDMLELGFFEKKYHREIGEFLSELKPNCIICIGNLSRIVFNSFNGKNKYWFESADESYGIVETLFRTNTAILVKGSRSVGLDKLVDILRNREVDNKTAGIKNRPGVSVSP